MIPVHMNVNGQQHELSLEDQGACGACTVLADGERINARLTPAVQCDGV
ncbi:hypothetical protein [Nonomuraea turkmeniaca]|nr:hypothetical protein [Nonomuraea turkmeniaca]